MGNIISLDAAGRHFAMSNGLTSVLIDVLGLSGTRLAKTDTEKRMIVWLLEKDQSAAGGGTVGFDICEMPWNDRGFDDMKRFWLCVIEAAKRRTGWELLDYPPNEALLFPCLDRFHELISKAEPDIIDHGAVESWLCDTREDPDDPILCGYPQCPKHHVFLTVFGCHLCNGQS